MSSLKEHLDKHLIDLAWSLWTELGVAGIQNKHRQFLIQPEELILLTSVIGETDPRLRDEALDWCSRYHSLISVSRLKTLAKAFGELTIKSFSIFAATLNSISGANWPVLVPSSPLKCKPSGKSKSPRFENPALLLFRLRALFGVGARADLIGFFLAKKADCYTVADTIDTGYTKRNLADVLDGFAQAKICDVSMVRNHKSYRFTKRDDFLRILGPLPGFMPSWRDLFETILKLRDCIHRTEAKTIDVRVVEIRNTLIRAKNLLSRLNWTPPPFQADFEVYWNSFSAWILQILKNL
ncbi:MAG: hypothetical protein A3E80_03590 [Chlamydiae bacterium RIFCSPHIGHO2_12_FULL_49_9]|nr:MAG: hypothetical protein A3E80_03590 [Chlamydiae bacterium RIFCSPHIGHO2_12_FULL_49_9]